MSKLSALCQRRLADRPRPRGARASIVWSAAVALLYAISCGPSTPGTDGGGTGASGTTDSTGGISAGTADSGADSGSGGMQTPLSSVSVLMVLDNTPSMAEEQAPLAQALGGMAEQLTAAGIDWRLGVTTTDNGNLWCTSTTPEGGQLVLSSCRSRPTEFVFDGGAHPDWFDSICQSHCPEQWEVIEVTPTAIDGEGPAPRPWIETIDGSTNLPEGLSLTEAMHCLIPQGVSGCGFESPMESMLRAIDRAQKTSDIEPSGGFLPSGALLAVVFVTDEADCSANPSWETIFSPDGERVYWSDPTGPAPTSAVCWNAGVECSGGTCMSTDRDAIGNPVAPQDAGTDAVLYPLSRYTDQLNELSQVLVTVIAGTQLDGTVVYADSPDDPQFMGDFGIGPGCQSATSSAVPPVRLRELAEHFPHDGGPHLASICEPNYDATLSELAAAIVAQLP